MDRRNQPMEIQSNALRDHLRPHEITARPSRPSQPSYILSSRSRLIVVETLRSRSNRPSKIASTINALARCPYKK